MKYIYLSIYLAKNPLLEPHTGMQLKWYLQKNSWQIHHWCHVFSVSLGLYLKGMGHQCVILEEVYCRSCLILDFKLSFMTKPAVRTSVDWPLAMML